MLEVPRRRKLDRSPIVVRLVTGTIPARIKMSTADDGESYSDRLDNVLWVARRRTVKTVVNKNAQLIGYAFR